jgi:AraC family transcriptional regulator, transcriptional activator of pobA
MDSLLNIIKQNDKLPIRLVTPGFGHLSPEEIDRYGYTHRKAHYFFLFMVDGCTQHRVDLQQFDINTNELLIVLPHQVHELSNSQQKSDYFKIGFDENCLSMLPKQYPFLVNPLNIQKLTFRPSAVARLKSIFGILLELLSVMTTDPELILSYLNSLLTEINIAYFSSDLNPADNRLSKYIGFKVFVENNLTDHPTIKDIAEELAINTNSLYSIVKHYSGLSPKEFIINRLILEARRRLYYGENASIKELAFDLGFNDPEYFSRLFKKVTGKTIAGFFHDLSGK